MQPILTIQALLLTTHASATIVLARNAAVWVGRVEDGDGVATSDADLVLDLVQRLGSLVLRPAACREILGSA